MNLMQSAFLSFLNLKIKVKLLWIYIFASCLSLILLVLVLKATIGRQLFLQEESMLKNVLNQSISQLENRISDTMNLSNTIYNNDDLISACNIEYGTDYYKMYDSYSNHIQPDLYIYQCLIPEVTNIRIYTSCDLIPYKDLVAPVSSIQDKPWFGLTSSSNSPNWILDEQNGTKLLASVRKFPQIPAYPFENYLYLEVNYDTFFSSLNSIGSDSYGIIVTDKNNSILYESSTFEDSAFPIQSQLFSENYGALLEKYDDDYLFLSSPIESSGWTVYYYSPLAKINKAVNQAFFTVFLLIALCFGVLFLLTFLTVNSMLSPLLMLTKVIEKVSLENIDKHELIIIPNRKDEIGALIHTFNSMLKRIRALIDESYVQTLKAKEYQLNALRAQINPHFLYNTLSLISAKTIIAEQYEVSETVQLLSLFYRTSLNKGQDITTIRNELENIRAYISIQLILMDHAFDVLYDLDDTLLDQPMPCLILQPLVENAIEHGLRNSRKEKKELIITLSHKDHIALISIEDNGLGISRERLECLFSLETDHIGIKNVNERLKLSYGETMGLTVESTRNVNTKVSVSIPVQLI